MESKSASLIVSLMIHHSIFKDPPCTLHKKLLNDCGTYHASGAFLYLLSIPQNHPVVNIIMSVSEMSRVSLYLKGFLGGGTFIVKTRKVLGKPRRPDHSTAEKSQVQRNGLPHITAQGSGRASISTQASDISNTVRLPPFLTSLGEQSVCTCSLLTNRPQQALVPATRDMVWAATILFIRISEVCQIEKFQGLALGSS